MAGKLDREPCGCKADARAWLELCPAHEAEVRETRERWHFEHALGPASPTRTFLNGVLQTGDDHAKHT